MREVVLLSCKDCKNRNYATKKDKKKQTGKLEAMKYCKHCNKHTLHKETKA